MHCCIEEIPRWKMVGSDPSRHIITQSATEEQRTENVWKSQVSGSALIDHPIGASRALTKNEHRCGKILGCAPLSKSLFTTYLSTFVATILSLVFTTFDRCLQELLRDWKATPSRKSVPNIFLQWATSLSPLIVVGFCLPKAHCRFRCRKCKCSSLDQ